MDGPPGADVNFGPATVKFLAIRQSRKRFLAGAFFRTSRDVSGIGAFKCLALFASRWYAQGAVVKLLNGKV